MTAMLAAFSVFLIVPPGPVEAHPAPRPSIRQSLAKLDYSAVKLEAPARTTSIQTTPAKRARSTGRMIGGAVMGAIGGFFVGGAVGYAIPGSPKGGDDGLNNLIWMVRLAPIGALIGAFVGAEHF